MRNVTVLNKTRSMVGGYMYYISAVTVGLKFETRIDSLFDS